MGLATVASLLEAATRVFVDLTRDAALEWRGRTNDQGFVRNLQGADRASSIQSRRSLEIDAYIEDLLQTLRSRATSY